MAAANSRVTAASAAMVAALTNPSTKWIRQVAQIGGPDLTRMNCFIGRPWLSEADKLGDPRLTALVYGLVNNLCPAVPGSDPNSWLYVDRDLLKTLSAAARAATPDRDDRLVQLWLATMIWGHPRDNRGPAKVAGALGTYAAVVTTLRHSMRLLDGGNLAGAFATCSYGGQSYLPRFGESFFTKWLWSAGLASGQDPLPLVFDDRVRAAMASIGQWSLVGRNASQRYVDYCTLADGVATNLTRRYGPVSAEKVEYALYCLAP